jgi:hypothetical protein
MKIAIPIAVGLAVASIATSAHACYPDPRVLREEGMNQAVIDMEQKNWDECQAREKKEAQRDAAWKKELVACLAKLDSLRIGMSAGEVKEIAPCLNTTLTMKVNTTETAAHRRQQWAVYDWADRPSSPISLGYLYFEDGQLVEIQKRW